jgi:hypothetical protein
MTAQKKAYLDSCEATMRPLPPLIAVAQHMEKLGWYESRLFSHAFLLNGWCVGLWPDGWSLSYATEIQGIYAIKSQGTMLSELQKALADAGLYQEAA